MPFLIIAAVAIFIFLKTPQGKGFVGELLVKLIIGKTKPNEQYVINNLTLRIDDNRTSQIDHVLINRLGVFVIETKNYSGRIYGDDYKKEWTQVLNYGKVKNHFYSPIKQNYTHVCRIKELLPENIPVYSIVVFVKGNIAC